MLRPATAADRPFLVSLYGCGRTAEMSSWGWSEEQQNQFIAMQFSARCSQYDAVYPYRDEQIVLLDNIMAGVISVAQNKLGMQLVDIAMLPEYRGKGLGGRLLQGLQQEATKNRIPLRLHVLAENSGAVSFYQRLGFGCIEEGVYRLLEWRPDTA